MTREEVWDVLLDCYHIACPSTAQGTTTGSIVWHGCARGPSDSVEEHCDEHHHIATLSLRKCYWRKIKKVAAQVPLHAVCHDSCSSMYCYPHAPSDQKLLSELDSHYGLSRVHPSGEASQKILAEGKDFANVGLRGCTRRLKISSSLSLLHSSIRWWTMVRQGRCHSGPSLRAVESKEASPHKVCKKTSWWPSRARTTTSRLLV